MQSVFDTLRHAAQVLQEPKVALRQRLSHAARAVEDRLRAAAVRAQTPRPRADAQVPETTWMTLVRPSLVDARTPLRRVAEPVVAIVAVGALAALGSLALASLAGFVFACLMAIAILTQIFGLSLDIDIPRPHTP